MPVADALADAETLRRVVADMWRGRSFVDCPPEKKALFEAGVHGAVYGWPVLTETPDRNAAFATRAARAAFRAVPGLREGRP